MSNSKALELANEVIGLDALNNMLDDFSTVTLAKYASEINRIEARILELAKEITEDNKNTHH